MTVTPIQPVSLDLAKAGLMDNDLMAMNVMSRTDIPASNGLALKSDPFQTVFDQAIHSLGDVSGLEQTADALAEKFMAGKADIPEVMIAMSKANLAVQFAVTTVTSAVNTFKEITQIQI